LRHARGQFDTVLAVRRPPKPPLACLLAIFIALLAFPALAAAEEGSSTSYTKEEKQAYEEQLKSGNIKAVKINKRDHDLLITLKNGELVFVHLEKHDTEKAESQLHAKGVTYTVESAAEAEQEVKSKPVKHKLRYIIGGVVVVALIAGGGYLLYRRKAYGERE